MRNLGGSAKEEVSAKTAFPGAHPNRTPCDSRKASFAIPQIGKVWVVCGRPGGHRGPPLRQRHLRVGFGKPGKADVGGAMAWVYLFYLKVVRYVE